MTTNIISDINQIYEHLDNATLVRILFELLDRIKTLEEQIKYLDR